MGFHEFGQSIFGIIIFMAAMLVAFGGYQNQDIYQGFLPQGVTNPNDINNTNVLISTSQATPFATTTSANSGQDNNPLLNLIFNQIGQIFKSITELPGALIDMFTYMGLPRQIAFPLIVGVSVTVVVYVTYYIAQVGVGALAGFFK